MKTKSEIRFPWKCPRCGAPANAHGKGGGDKCHYNRRGDGCMGFICECPDEGNSDHGQTLSSPCNEANCYHCGWGGTFPEMPKGVQAWEKKALEAGWVPPAPRAKELSKK